MSNTEQFISSCSYVLKKEQEDHIIYTALVFIFIYVHKYPNLSCCETLRADRACRSVNKRFTPTLKLQLQRKRHQQH